jgi:hypothetical protein
MTNAWVIVDEEMPAGFSALFRVNKGTQRESEGTVTLRGPLGYEAKFPAKCVGDLRELVRNYCREVIVVFAVDADDIHSMVGVAHSHDEAIDLIVDDLQELSRSGSEYGCELTSEARDQLLSIGHTQTDSEQFSGEYLLDKQVLHRRMVP